jgi:hypothetical protein
MTVFIDYLDTNVPVQITSGSKFFDEMCKSGTHHADLVVDLLHRETAQIAEFALRTAQRALEQKPKPQFIPAIRATGPIPLITEQSKSIDGLLAAWASDPDTAEIPVLHIPAKRRKTPYWFRRAFWAVVDAPRDFLDWCMS